jgi:hypothetical protein
MFGHLRMIQEIRGEEEPDELAEVAGLVRTISRRIELL